MKATTLIITVVLNLGIGGALLFMLLVALNGFTGKQAEAGLILFVVWVILNALLTGVLSFFTVGYLIEKKSFNGLLAAFLAIVIFAVVGAVIDVVGFFAAVFLTSAMR